MSFPPRPGEPRPHRPRRPLGIRRRILRSFVFFGAALVAVYAVLVLVAMARLEDQIFIQRLDRRADEVAAALRQGGADTEPAPFDAFHTYVGRDALPPELRDRVGGRPAGDYEFHDAFPVSNSNEHFVAVRDLEGLDDRLYVVYDAVAYEGMETWWAPIIWVLAGGALVTLLLGLPFGRRLAGELAAPLAELAAIVESSGPDEIAERLGGDPGEGDDATSAGAAADEVSVLRRALRGSMARTAAFVDRERHFTRNASHELRTPLTVIRGAADLLQRQLSDDPRAVDRLGRIQRSVDHMEELIEAFLALAREDAGAGGESCEVGEVLGEVVERPALRGGPARLEWRVHHGHRVAAPRAIVASTLVNLLANALQLTPEGTVTASLDGNVLEIVDGGPGIDGDQARKLTAPFVSHRPGGTGVGLAIVSEVCDRYGWDLSFQAAEGGGTHTRLDFGPPADPGPATTRPVGRGMVN